MITWRSRTHIRPQRPDHEPAGPTAERGPTGRSWSLLGGFAALAWFSAQATGALAGAGLQPFSFPGSRGSGRRPLQAGEDAALATFDINPLFADDMVLSHQRPRVYGRAAPGERVHVEIPELSHGVETTSNEKGRWVAQLGGLRTGGPYTLAVHGPSLAKNITLSRVWVGEVFLFMGQSNNDFPLHALAYGDSWGRADHLGQRRVEQEYIRGLNRHVHFYIAKSHASQTAEVEHKQRLGWLPVDQHFHHIGGLAYLFASRVQPRVACPVGILQVTAGGSSTHEWLAPEQLSLFEHQDAMPTASKFFHGMVAPLTDLQLTATVLSLGESDTPQPFLRDARFVRGLVAQTRQLAEQPQMPFLVMGLTGHRQRQNTPVEWPEGGKCYDVFLARETQIAAVQATPHSAYVVSTDVGEVDDIHFPNKWEMARRGVHALRALTDQPEHPHLSPIMSSWQIEGSEIVVHFNNSADRLGVGHHNPRDGLFDRLPFSELKGMAMTDASYVWRWANATYRDHALRVFAEGIDAPVAARYNWARNPIGNLYALSYGLPVAPWRTDDFEMKVPDGEHVSCSKGAFLHPHELREKLALQRVAG